MLYWSHVLRAIYTTRFELCDHQITQRKKFYSISWYETRLNLQIPVSAKFSYLLFSKIFSIAWTTPFKCYDSKYDISIYVAKVESTYFDFVWSPYRFEAVPILTFLQIWRCSTSYTRTYNGTINTLCYGSSLNGTLYILSKIQQTAYKKCEAHII